MTTSDKKWTGGEWLVRGHFICNEQGIAIGEAMARGTETPSPESNAVLWANAKRLYEALELALTRMAHKQDCMVCLPSDQWPQRGAYCQCEIAIVKAALDAARGEK